MKDARQEPPAELAVSDAGRLDPAEVRRDFPILQRHMRGKPLVYLDSAATSQKPSSVIETITRFSTEENANVHRGVYELAEKATARFEDARKRTARFLGARLAEEIVFVRGVTEAINLVAHAFVEPRLEPDDEILITAMEHHSNIVPWQLLCERTGARLAVAPISDEGALEVDEFAGQLGPRTKFVALTHVSNVLGTVNPVAKLVALAHELSIPVLVDGAQAAPHLRIDVQELGCDFYAVSGHKMMAPSGIGALFGRANLLAGMRPWQGGGDMIRSVSFEGTTYNDPPYRFEAGTPNVAGAIGMGAAVDYLEALGRERIFRSEHELLVRLTSELMSMPGLRILGTAPGKVAVVSFVVDGLHAQDVATLLDIEGIAVRAGHHCAEPLLRRLGVDSTLRVSLAPFNTHEDIDRLLMGLQRAHRILMG